MSVKFTNRELWISSGVRESRSCWSCGGRVRSRDVLTQRRTSQKITHTHSGLCYGKPVVRSSGMLCIVSEQEQAGSRLVSDWLGFTETGHFSSSQTPSCFPCMNEFSVNGVANKADCVIRFPDSDRQAQTLISISCPMNSCKNICQKNKWMGHIVFCVKLHQVSLV